MGDSKNISKNATKAGVWYTVSTICTKAVLIFTTPIFTRLLTKEDYGIAATFTSWFSLLSVFASLNLMYSIGRAKIDYTDKLNKFVGSLYTLSGSFMAVIAILMFIFRNQLALIMELPAMLVILLAVQLFCSPAVEFQQAYLKYRYKYIGNIAISAFITLTTIAVTFILIYFMPTDRYYARVIGTVCPIFLLSITFWVKSFVNRDICINRDYWKYGLQISLPLILNTVSLQIMAQSDRVMITKFVGSESTAIYTLAYQYAIMINIVFDAIGKAWLPWFHDAYASNWHKDIRDNTVILLNFGAIMSLGCIALAPEAILILGGNSYMEGQWIVCPLVLGIICRFIFVQFEHIELHLMKTQYTAMGTVIAAIVNICLNIIFIPKFGFIAAAYTTLTSYFVLMNVHCFFTRIKMGIKLFNIVHMYILFILTVILALIIQKLYGHVFIRFGLITAMVIAFVVKYKDVLIGIIDLKKKTV